MDASDRPKQSEDHHTFSEGKSESPLSNLESSDQILINLISFPINYLN